jgi:hypothetical protein
MFETVVSNYARPIYSRMTTSSGTDNTVAN